MILQNIEEWKEAFESQWRQFEIQEDAWNHMKSFVKDSGITVVPDLCVFSDGSVEASWDVYDTKLELLHFPQPLWEVERHKSFTLRFDPQGKIFLEQLEMASEFLVWKERDRDVLLEFVKKYLPTQ